MSTEVYPLRVSSRTRCERRRRSPPSRRRAERAPCPCRRSPATRRRSLPDRPRPCTCGRPRRRARARSGRTGSAPTRGRWSSRPCGRAGRASPCGSFMSTSITDRRISSAGPPPTASRKSVSPEKQRSPTTNETPSSEWPGVASASMRRPPVSHRPRRHLQPEALDELVVPRDMVGVPVRDEEVRRRQALALDRVEERLQRSAAVDEHRRSAGLVSEEECVRQPARVHAALDDHAADPTGRVRHTWKNRAATDNQRGRNDERDVRAARDPRGGRRSLVDLPRHRDRLARLRPARVPVGLHDASTRSRSCSASSR